MTIRYGSLLASLRTLQSPGIVFAPTFGAIRYRTTATRGIAPLLDIYLPHRVRTRGPSIVLVHGGGFAIGSRRMKAIRYLAAHLTAAGIAVCAIDYRMIFRGGRLDEAIDDVCEAFTFWSAHIHDHDLDPSAISIAGLSAGGTLALLAAPRLTNLATVVSCFGLYETDHLRGAASLLPRLLFRSPDRAVWSARSPRRASQPIAPTLLLHGGDDDLVPVEQARSLAAHRERLGLPTRLVVYDGAPHGFFNEPMRPASEAVVEIAAFVRR